MPHSSANGAGYTISSALKDRDFDALYAFLSDSYWARSIPRAIVERSVRGSLPFVLRDAAGRLAGFARVITDRATFGHIGDLFVLPEHRGKGLSKRLMEVILAHPDLQNFRRWMLATCDAHGVYEKVRLPAARRPGGLDGAARSSRLRTAGVTSWPSSSIWP
jgi:GNAT superfamily N-acetyltransferase